MTPLHFSLPSSTILLLLLSFFTQHPSSAHGQCLSNQRSALLQLKQSFITPKLQSWKNSTTSDCCRWEGVTCNPFTGEVTSLELSNLAISGELHPALFTLTSLQNLSLAYNLFTNATLPEPGFEKLPNLIHLNLSNSGFVGQVPIGLSYLTNLVLLDLSTFLLNIGFDDCLYIREPNIKTLLGNLTKIETLILDGVNISSNGSEWGKAVSQLGPTIQRLSLSDCSLTGPFDPSLIRLRRISYLRLAQNEFNSPVPEFFADFSYLSVLQLSYSLIVGEFPERIFQLRNLKEIDLSYNPMLSGQLPDFEKHGALQKVILSETIFYGKIPDSIGYLQNLSIFFIYNCSFHGEIPNNFQNLVRLSQLDISQNRFTGKVPEFHNWPRISKYVLNNNNFTGSIPNANYSNLLYLSIIDMRNNSLTGTIPTSLFSLPSLQTLLLSQNQLSGNLMEFANIVSLSALQTIDISSNNLQGTLPSSIFKLSQLNVLNFASNNFTGTLDLDSLWYLKNLTTFDLSNNMLSVTDGIIIGNKSWYKSFPNIKNLKLASCNLTKFPSFIKYQTGISTLDLSNNEIEGDIPNWIQNIGNQTFLTLNLSRNRFTGLEDDTIFLNFNTLVVLDLHSNMLIGSVPFPPATIIVFDLSNNFFSSLPPTFTSYLGFTVYLSLSNNSLTGSIPESICNASYLQVLDLSYNNFTGELPDCLLESNNSLSVLNLKNNRLNGSLPKSMSKECRFRTLNLNRNSISGTLPESLMNCISLEVLDLGNNEINGTFPYWLGELKYLRVLVLRSNNLFGPILAQKSSQLGKKDSAFSMLQIFDISSNSFNGTLPKEFFKTFNSMMADSNTGDSLTVGVLGGSYYHNSVTVTFKGLEVTLINTLAIFTSLDFSSNNFEGEIPYEIGDLKRLLLLNMSYNAFNGTIPPQIGELNQLESLDLSSNELTGNIPLSLTSLTFLATLNLSHNDLIGRIPYGHQFTTFSNNSYLFNPNLCGDPLTVQCGSPFMPNSPVSDHKCSSIAPNWRFVFTGLGFGTGLAVVIVPLLIWDKWRERCYGSIDFLLRIVVPLWICSSCIYKRVGSDDDDEEDNNGGVFGLDGEEEDEEEELERPRFCLYCTKLEIVGERAVIHHVECSCQV